MKKTKHLFSVTTVLLLILNAGCSLPAADNRVAVVAADGSTVDPVRGPAQHPAVYEVRVNSGTSYRPSLAWNKTNNEYGMAWVIDRFPSGTDIYFSRMSAAGVKLKNDVRIAKGDANYYQVDPILVWNSKQNEYGLVWYRVDPSAYRIYFARISAQGEKIGGTVTLDSGHYCQHPFLAYNATNNEYGVVWERQSGSDYYDENTYGLYFSHLDKDGNKVANYDGATKTSIQSSYQVGSTRVHNQTAAMTWNPDRKEYGITFARHAVGGEEKITYLYFITRTRTGYVDDAAFLKLDDTDANEPFFSQVVWAAERKQYHVVWYDSSRVRGQRIDQNGTKAGDKITYPKFSDKEYTQPFVVWNSKEEQYGICWHTSDFVRFILADKQGKYISGSGKALGDANSNASALAWNKTNNEYGICWYNIPDNSGVFFAHLSKSGKEQPQGILYGAVTGTMPGAYYIRNMGYGTYLASLKGTSQLFLNQFNQDAPRTQMWQLIGSTSDGIFKLLNMESNRYITGYVSGGSPTSLLGTVSSGGNLYKWWVYPYSDDGAYLLRVDGDVAYRIYAGNAATPELSLVSSGTNKKKWQLIPAEY